MSALYCCNDTYRRDADGIWRYPWGAPVAGASDLTLGDVLAIGVDEASLLDDLDRALSPAEAAWCQGARQDIDGVHLADRPGPTRDVGDLVVGMLAPELHAATMLTAGAVARRAGVSAATIHAYRSRGVLPAPQVVSGRAPLWASPIVGRWLATRPGGGRRTDLTEHQGRTRPLSGGSRN
jgi:hypothetical protein